MLGVSGVVRTAVNKNAEVRYDKSRELTDKKTTAIPTTVVPVQGSFDAALYVFASAGTSPDVVGFVTLELVVKFEGPLDTGGIADEFEIEPEPGARRETLTQAQLLARTAAERDKNRRARQSLRDLILGLGRSDEDDDDAEEEIFGTGESSGAVNERSASRLGEGSGSRRGSVH